MSRKLDEQGRSQLQSKVQSRVQTTGKTTRPRMGVLNQKEEVNSTNDEGLPFIKQIDITVK